MTLALFCLGVLVGLWLLDWIAPAKEEWSARREAELMTLACLPPIEHPEEYARLAEPWALTTREIERIEAEAFWRRLDARQRPKFRRVG